MGTMGKKKSKKQWDKATLADVTKEMAKPRVARSAREHSHVFPEDITRLRQASRGERHSGANYELATRSRHSP